MDYKVSKLRILRTIHRARQTSLEDLDLFDYEWYWYKLLKEDYRASGALWHASTARLARGTKLLRGWDRTGLTDKKGAWCSPWPEDTNIHGEYVYLVEATKKAKFVKTEWGRCYYKGWLKVVDVYTVPSEEDFKECLEWLR